MTIPEIEAILKTTEGQAVLKKLTDGLEGNKNEILSEKKKLADNLQSINTKMTELETERDSLQTENISLRVNGAVEKVMDTIGVAPNHRRAVAALIRSETLQIKEQDGEQIVVIGKDSKPIEVWAMEWSQSEEGKSYILSPANTGGGAGGSIESGSGAFDPEGKTPEEILENLPKAKR